jgi:hypothetical protein
MAVLMGTVAEGSILMGKRKYLSQAARDAEAMGYGNKRYWEYLDAAAIEHYDYFMAQGLQDRANEMLTRSLSEALMGNEGE